MSLLSLKSPPPLTTNGQGEGIQIRTEADETTSGPASLIIVDLDGNPILIDQHI